jgi:hypothetical protein
MVVGQFHRFRKSSCHGFSSSPNSQGKRDLWTADEDSKLLRLYNEYTQSGRRSWWSDISSEMGTRSPSAVELRMRRLIGGLSSTSAR